jgi:uncharacterized phage protein (TIGR01671 family)
MWDNAEAMRLMYNETTGFSNTRFILMQYTGLKDKNGKEIYEGDILSINPDIIKETSGCSIYKLAFVLYKDGAFQYEYINKPQAPDQYRFEYHKMQHHEVIGNIYEHSHLLNSEQNPTKERRNEDASSTQS